MPNTEKHVAALEQAYDQWIEARGERYEFWLALVGPGFRLTSAGAGEDRPDYFRAKSAEEVAIYFEGIKRDWKMIEFRVDEYIAQGDSVVARIFCVWENRATGKIVSTIKLDHWRFKDGKLSEVHESFDTGAMLVAMQP